LASILRFRLLPIIPAQAPGSGQGAAYEFVDQEIEGGKSYYYRLEEVALNGQTTMHPPVSATVNAPTAVSLGELATTSSSISWLFLTALLLAIAGLATVGWHWRRRFLPRQLFR
jgi:hypothetical protein